MNSLLSNLIKDSRYNILFELKRNPGLSISELTKKINLSYMGVKQHCLALEKEGFLETHKRQKSVGRPEIVYCLTEKADVFFPKDPSFFVEKLLNGIEALYGSLVLDRLLYWVYRKDGEYLSQAVKNLPLEDRAKELLSFREEKGYMGRLVIDNEIEYKIIEFHNPILALLDKYPIIRSFEKKMFEKVLGVPVKRIEDRSFGSYYCTFLFQYPPSNSVHPNAEQNG
ncbi:helix-turn-helix transcriptional regulator [Methylacidiphilum caldifontis]|uniref:Transcriptional regulator n=1 Tax=Methylacidiphilum caldifontis TaxID=2795386 RepID=A0A4Y8P6W0_9BACT|nr:winged helix-turn-helix transcriptional regulator [Methylacidiphilum caldifontis]QSR88840.1 winged helix-turn-helix transcriptional regulator [Methylacidiphilum caldifontis]TFE65909.1 transcriptional regulator [Methylacidiphilum caldifontis]